MDKTLIKHINLMQSEIDGLNKQIEDLKSKVELKQNSIEEAKKLLLAQMQNEKLDEFKDEENNLVATVFNKTNIGYSSDSEVITKLKGTEFAKFIKIKTTESLDKNPLKKEIKTNKTLEKLLKPLIVESNTTWVVVTTGENHTKMLEHIEENSKKGK